ncbi:MAG: peptidase M75 [Bacteroidales bacterium]|nr:peptidase M75 [Bacteroidales bacterium]
MKRLIINVFALATLMCGSMTFVACSDKNDDTDDVAAAAVAQQFVDHTVAPTYSALAAKTQELVEQLVALKANPTDANMATACATFLEARAWWEKSEAFLFGAAGDFGIDPHIDSWPLDQDAFNALMNSPNMLSNLDSEDGDVVAGDQLGNALLGFHGIEYILFRNGQPRAASSLTDNELIYVVAVAGDLRNRCFQLEVSWLGDKAPQSHIDLMEELEMPYTCAGGDKSYGENMIDAGNAGSTYSSRLVALMAIVDGCRSIADEVGTSKIGKPHNGEDPNYIESPYSQTSIIDFHNNIVSIENAYMGGIEGERNNAKSLHQFVKDHDKDLDARVTAAIAEALSKIDAMPAPFVNNYTNASCGEAVEACQNLDDILGEVNDMLTKI